MQRLVEVLTDSNEKIRNDMLLLLRLLTESNPDVRQFMAFAEGFDRLFHIMHTEGRFNRRLHALIISIGGHEIVHSSLYQALTDTHISAFNQPFPLVLLLFYSFYFSFSQECRASLLRIA